MKSELGIVRIQKHRNPSFDFAPHCTLKPRFCYCMTDKGICKCEAGRVGMIFSIPSQFSPHVFDGTVASRRLGQRRGNELWHNEMADFGDTTKKTGKRDD